MKKIIGMGNAILDVFVEGSDEKLQQNSLTKGGMHLVDSKEWQKISKSFPLLFTSPGGSITNTITSLAQLGIKCSIFTALGKDNYGKTLTEHFDDLGINTNNIATIDDAPTARSLIIITPDGQRTMITHLGAAGRLGKYHVSMPVILDSSMMLVEGYLVGEESSFKALLHTIEICNAQNIPALVTLGDANTIIKHKKRFEMAFSVGCPIIAGNISEVGALYGTSSMADTVLAAQSDGRIHIITNGEKGSVICEKNNVVQIPPIPAQKVVDTTGAGDQYLAGFLVAHLKGSDYEEAGKFASVMGSAIVEQIGATFHREIKDIFIRAMEK